MNSLQVQEVSQIPQMEGGFIFNTSEFQSLKAGEIKAFVLLDKERPIARICFKIDKNKAISGYKATFGSIDGEAPLASETAVFFLKQVCVYLKDYGLQEVIIKNWPECYDISDDLTEIFSEVGFDVIFNEINQHIAVGEKEFELLIKKNERKKLKQSIKQGYSFKPLLIDDFRDVYQLVTRTRVSKGYPVSMTYEELYRTIKLLPDKYLLFGLFDHDTLIAASVSIRVSKDILYNFYHADKIDHRSTSPIVMLVQEIYGYCLHQGIKILDLGVSSENGLINSGLFNFKKNLGCLTSDKKTYRLIYA